MRFDGRRRQTRRRILTFAAVHYEIVACAFFVLPKKRIFLRNLIRTMKVSYHKVLKYNITIFLKPHVFSA